MKQFCCGDVVPGCTATFRAEDEAQLLEAVAIHAKDAHGMTEIPDSLVAGVKTRILTVAA